MITPPIVLIKTTKKEKKRKEKTPANSRDSGSVMVKNMGLESDYLGFYLGSPFLVEFTSY